MDLVTQCPACGSDASRGWPALVAPFVAEFALEAPVAACKLLECDTCEMRFFEARYTEDELSRLYTGYRGPRYFEVRHRHEPWYTERFNQGFGNDAARGAARQDGLKRFLMEAGAPGPFRSILDYGGDTGRLIPLDVTTDAVVYDVSGVAPIPGVRSVQRPDDLVPGTYDVVLLSHVLEHVPNPMALLETLHRLPRPDGGLLYVEVPFERPWMGLAGRGSATRAWLDGIRRTDRALRLLDFYSTLFRVKAGVVPPLGFAKLHEHVNFFNERALASLLGRCGYDVVRIGRTSSTGTGGARDGLACVARPRPV